MKIKRIPFIGFYFYAASFIVLLIAFIFALSAFNGFNLSPDRFVVVFPLFAMWIILIEVVMAFVDKNKPAWFHAIDILFCFFVLFAFGKLLIPFLTPIGILYTVNMGDVEIYKIVVPRCLAGCVLFVISTVFFIAGSFFKIVKIKETN